MENNCLTCKVLTEPANSPYPCEFCKETDCVSVSQPSDDSADYRIECLRCGKVYWTDGPDF